MGGTLRGIGWNGLLDFAFDLREEFVNVFSVQQANKDYSVILKGNANPVISDSQTKIIPTSLEFLQFRHLSQRIRFFNGFNYFFDALQ